MGLRRRAREIALQFLFSHDFLGQSNDRHSVTAAWEQFRQHFEVAENLVPYATELVVGICQNLAQIDALLADHSHNWRLERMSGVDRNILRIALFEMKYTDNVPARVAINEAIEISKRYSLGDSVAFINGILDGVAATQAKDSLATKGRAAD